MTLIIGTMARRGDDPRLRHALYQAALDRGLTTFDTAPLYGFGAAERILGEALARVPRDAVRIYGKVGLRWDASARGDVLFEARDGAGNPVRVRRDSRPEAVQDDVARSLERLQTDYLDLAQVHQPDPHTPIADTMDALRELRASGRIRAVGVSNFDARQLDAAAKALGDVPLFSLQSDYSLLVRSLEQETLPFCRERRIALLAYSPLATGWLARPPGAATESRLRQAMEQSLRPMAARYGVAPAAVALRWVMDQPGVGAAISGISTMAQLQEQASALSLALDATELDALEQSFRGAAARESARRRGGLTRRLRRRVGVALRGLGVDPKRLRRRAVREKW